MIASRFSLTKPATIRTREVCITSPRQVEHLAASCRYQAPDSAGSNPVSPGFAVSDDARAAVWIQVERSQSDVMLMDSWRQQ